MDPSVSGFYRHIMDDVLRKTRESILIGMDEQTLDMTVERLLSLWENKLVRLGAESQTSSNEPPPLPLINDAPAKVKKTTNVPLKHMPAPAPYGGFAQDGKAANPYEDILPDRSAVNMKKETKPTVSASSSSTVAAPIPVVKDSPKSVPVAAPAPAEPAVPSATTGRQVKAAVVGRQVKTAPVSNAGKKRGAEAEPEAPQPNSKKSKKVVEEEEEEEDRDGDDDHESDLGSDLDDDDDREPETDNVLLCQYTKVMRTKNRWKINVKDAILRVRGKDYLFKEVTGEFNF